VVAPLGPFDPLLLSEARLGVVSVLIARREATFSDLKELLGLTQGNLGVHLRKLEEAGYVELEKAFVERRPRSTYRITARGRAAFLAHVEQLRAIAEADDPT
jgi:DNA-binding MarR family transcriptional regulator